MRERDSRAKLRQKEYADKTRGAKHSNIEEGDKVLLKQTRENKLSPHYEPEPYVVIRKDANAVVLQDKNRNNKMHNIAHMKKFIGPEPDKKRETDQPSYQDKQPVQLEEHHSDLIPSQPADETHEAPPSPMPGDSVASRPSVLGERQPGCKTTCAHSLNYLKKKNKARERLSGLLLFTSSLSCQSLQF